MPQRVRSIYDIRLAIRSPFLFRGLSAKLFGVDATQIRDEDGRPILPSDQIRGILREGLELLSDHTEPKVIGADDILSLFGKPSARNGDADDGRGNTNAPARGRIHFSDLTANKVLRGNELADLHRNNGLETTRVKIDEETGAAETGALQVLELVAPFGEVVLFEGMVVVYEDKAGHLGDLMTKALALHPSVGAFKSSGFGEIVHASSRITLRPAATASAPAPTATDGVVRLRVTFDRPVMVSTDKVADNADLGAVVVPGSVFKGALADGLRQRGEDPDGNAVLSRMVFGHAFPEGDKPGQRIYLPLPLSLVAETKPGPVGPDGTQKDDILFGDAIDVGLGQGAYVKGCEAPAKFTTDWKETWFYGTDEPLARPAFIDIPPVARTHAAINADAETGKRAYNTSGTAADRALYTTLARSVRRRLDDSSMADRSWLFDISLANLSEAERTDALKLIATMVAEGLDGIGRTGASARLSLASAVELERPSPRHSHPNEFTLMLLTPALILDPKAIWDETGKELMTAHDAYAAYFKAALGDGFKLLNFFAGQELSGGYQARRFRPYGADQYFPFLLTQPGSIFRFEGNVGDEKLARLLRTGLPLPSLKGARPLDWRNCPYVPENGFGHFTTRHLADETTAKLAGNVIAV
ncbi:RAMP superfamily CRISPR-associated protein [Pleomorphomonas sp. NRK KF1]|uniref:RAMP superfamily CRISPR-associated protein n=1 Tax=Pleomorphomonas sp. NRK KF1 TaxID=2943000 RepID=UPI002043440D|nr:RAMP superfamily CRISPR-associated protein [Pleomorphomonas sp. NRK KF1]MCM5552397.1 RAMP superfamily CRISPR-associated protein [Pleomorphomonas sp. NRK KF1]